MSWMALDGRSCGAPGHPGSAGASPAAVLEIRRSARRRGLRDSGIDLGAEPPAAHGFGRCRTAAEWARWRSTWWRASPCPPRAARMNPVANDTESHVPEAPLESQAAGSRSSQPGFGRHSDSQPQRPEEAVAGRFRPQQVARPAAGSCPIRSTASRASTWRSPWSACPAAAACASASSSPFGDAVRLVRRPD